MAPGHSTMWVPVPEPAAIVFDEFEEVDFNSVSRLM